MIYLFLHILGNTAFLLSVRLARQRQRQYLLIGTTNYATACVIATIVLAQSGIVPTWPALAFGAVQGFQYQTMFLLLFVMLSRSGVAVVVSLLRLSVAIPTIASIVIWQEYPNVWQTLGLILAAIAVPLLGSARRPREAGVGAERPDSEDTPRHPLVRRAGTVGFLALVLLLGGMGLLAAKSFAELRQEEQRPAYNFGTFATATALSALSWPLRHRFTQASEPKRPIPGASGRTPPRLPSLSAWPSASRTSRRSSSSCGRSSRSVAPSRSHSRARPRKYSRPAPDG